MGIYVVTSKQIYTREYYERNKDTIKARAKERYDSKAARAYYDVNREHILARQREYRAKNKVLINEKMRAGYFQWTYGISEDEYLGILNKQDGVCAICKTVPTPRGKRQRNFCVDHDHQTDKIRGLLCDPCNIAIAHLKEDPEILKSAISYLERYM